MLRYVPFTKELHIFLLQAGYTHIRLLGIAPKKNLLHNQRNSDEYILVPENGSIHLFEETDFQLEEIDSTEVKEMFDSPDSIAFLVALPAQIADRFNSGSK